MKAESTPEEAQCKQMLPHEPTHTSIECVTACQRNQFINLFLLSFIIVIIIDIIVIIV